MGTFYLTVFYIGIMLAVYYFFFRMISRRMGGGAGSDGGVFGVGKSKAKLYTVERSTGVTFRDVAGQEEAKESLSELVDYLHNPGKYQEIGARQPKGALLVGPPGTGQLIDNEVNRLLSECYGEAKRILGEFRSLLNTVAGYLIEKETITGEEFMRIVRAPV